jgi:Tfp pilus assembly protein PilF
MYSFYHRIPACAVLAAGFLLLTPFCAFRLTAQSTPIAVSPRDDVSAADTSQSWANLNEPILSREMPDSGFTHEPGPIAAPSPAMNEGPEASISAEMLRHPLSKKGRDLLTKAQKDSRTGNHTTAIGELVLAQKEPSAEPYAHALLGIEYLRTQKIPNAIAELQKANENLPRLAAIHSNLGLALCETGRVREGLQEVETALRLDPGMAKARFLKSVIMMEQGSYDPETRNDLQIAQKTVLSAHLALAIFYTHNGSTKAAEQQLESYADSGLGVSVAQAQAWLNLAMSGLTPAEALGLWSLRDLQTAGL